MRYKKGSWLAVLVLTAVLLFSGITATSASAAVATCGNTASHTKSYNSVYGTMLRHKAKARVCEDNSKITWIGQNYNFNEKVGAGIFYAQDNWGENGGTGANSTFIHLWGDIHFGFKSSVVDLNLARKHKFSFNFKMVGSQAVYTSSSSKWYLS